MLRKTLWSAVAWVTLATTLLSGEPRLPEQWHEPESQQRAVLEWMEELRRTDRLLADGEPGKTYESATRATATG